MQEMYVQDAFLICFVMWERWKGTCVVHDDRQGSNSAGIALPN